MLRRACCRLVGSAPPRALARHAHAAAVLTRAQQRASPLLRPLRCAFSSAPASSGSPPVGDAVLPPGAESPGEKFVMIYTCSVCETRAAKTISKHAYYKGVVLVRCPGCEKLHLIADRLGWFDDESTDVESILAAKGESVKVVTHENVLELTDADIIGRSRVQD